MSRSRRSALGLLAGMAATAGLAAWARPTIKESDSRPDFKLDSIIPAKFGSWQIDRNIPVILPPPDQQELLNKIYNQTLGRTYVNDQGYRVMLSLAYGGDQSDGLTVHIPEVCYVGQGFRLEAQRDARMTLGGLNIPVRRLVTTMGPRVEPITYWVTTGDEATISTWRRRMVSIKYGLRRRIPDGLLVRVSSIDRSDTEAYRMHDRFLVDLVAAMSTADKALLIGTISVPDPQT
ncbi:EpsI family protein [Burkholderiales bacterium JOSHI_001]|nr:EpsI family protein [Burkholderiales bacterium JOSHI_001]